MANKSLTNNPLVSFSILIATIVFILYCVFGSKISIDSKEVRVTGIWKTAVPVSEIREIKLIDKMPSKQRIIGISLGPLDLGTYSLENIGITRTYKMYAESPYLLIKTENNIILIGNGTENNKNYFRIIDESINIRNSR